MNENVRRKLHMKIFERIKGIKKKEHFLESNRFD